MFFFKYLMLSWLTTIILVTYMSLKKRSVFPNDWILFVSNLPFSWRNVASFVPTVGLLDLVETSSLWSRKRPLMRRNSPSISLLFISFFFRMVNHVHSMLITRAKKYKMFSYFFKLAYFFSSENAKGTAFNKVYSENKNTNPQSSFYILW